MDYDKNVLMGKYELGRLLGQGTFAKVYYARHLKTGQSVAIKVIDKKKVLRSGYADRVLREIAIMRTVKHPNVVELYEVMASRWKVYFVMEFVKGGDLFARLEKGKKLSETEVRRVFQQLVEAVDFCHSRGVFHRDLKLENLLLDEDGNLKITDFGLSAFFESARRDSLMQTTCGTPAYVAPEVIGRAAYRGDKADVWSCGVVLFVLLAGYFPFHDSNTMDLYRKISTGKHKCPKSVPSDAKKLIASILDPEPSTRISIEEIRESKWFKKGNEAREERAQRVGVNVGTDFSSVGRALDGQEVVRNAGPDFISGASNEQEVIENVGPSFSSAGTSSEEEVVKVESLMAFDIISLGLDLSGIFVKDKLYEKEVRFTLHGSAKTIVSKFLGLTESLKMRVVKKEGGVLKLERCGEGRREVLGIDVEIFEVNSLIHIVGMKCSSGDTLEFHKVFKEEIRPALDIARSLTL